MGSQGHTESSCLAMARRTLEDREESWLSPFACPSRSAVRRKPDTRADSGHRLQFAVDGDRVLHSLAYTRYIDKTQVFYLVSNDHISHRVLHVQFLSKIARTIGRMLRLNEDLVEAIALGHDIGHPPFGHDGEEILDRLCRKHGAGPFQHNVQSVRFLDSIERRGHGWNLSVQVLDGILCHNGEVVQAELCPMGETTVENLDFKMNLKREAPEAEVMPATLEGAVVRMADMISYIGRDLEDAERLRLIDRDRVPSRVREVLGITNGTIVYRLVEDLVTHSLDQNRIRFGESVAEALAVLYRFNVEHIYTNPRIKTQKLKIERLYECLFDEYLEDLEKDRRGSELFVDFLDELDMGVLDGLSSEEKVRDFMAGMTDAYFLKAARNRLLPEELPGRFE